MSLPKSPTNKSIPSAPELSYYEDVGSSEITESLVSVANSGVSKKKSNNDGSTTKPSVEEDRDSLSENIIEVSMKGDEQEVRSLDSDSKEASFGEQEIVLDDEQAKEKRRKKKKKTPSGQPLILGQSCLISLYKKPFTIGNDTNNINNFLQLNNTMNNKSVQIENITARDIIKNSDTNNNATNSENDSAVPSLYGDSRLMWDILDAACCSRHQNPKPPYNLAFFLLIIC